MILEEHIQDVSCFFSHWHLRGTIWQGFLFGGDTIETKSNHIQAISSNTRAEWCFMFLKYAGGGLVS